MTKLLSIFMSISLSMNLIACDDDDTSNTNNQAGEAMAGEAMAGEAMAGEAMAGEAMAGEEMAGEAMAGEAMAGEAMAGEAMAGEAMAGEAMAGEAMAGEAMAGEAMAGEAMAGEAIDSDEGVLPADWDRPEHCIATFNRAYSFGDSDDEQFTATLGQKYLLKKFNETSFVLLYITPEITVEVEADLADGEALPFDSNCEPSTYSNYTGVFVDTVIYRDEARTDVACELSSGTTVYGGLNYAAGGTFMEPTYNVFGRGLVAICDGLEEGYLNGIHAEILGVTTSTLPILSFLGVEP